MHVCFNLNLGGKKKFMYLTVTVNAAKTILWFRNSNIIPRNYKLFVGSKVSKKKQEIRPLLFAP